MTLTQELRAILLPEAQAPRAGAYRKIIIMVPSDPVCFFTLDHPTPGEAGPNRTYDLPIITPPRTDGIPLLPDQCLYAACKVGLAEASLIVEYLD